MAVVMEGIDDVFCFQPDETAALELLFGSGGGGGGGQGAALGGRGEEVVEVAGPVYGDCFGYPVGCSGRGFGDQADVVAGVGL